MYALEVPLSAWGTGDLKGDLVSKPEKKICFIFEDILLFLLHVCIVVEWMSENSKILLYCCQGSLYTKW